MPPKTTHIRPTSYSSSSVALKFVYYLDGKKLALISISDDVSILAYGKSKGK
jgi:hypothetical protein